MFSGIVEGLRPVTGVEKKGDFSRIRIDLGDYADGVAVGDSVSVNGVCLTVAALDGSVAKFDVMGETLKKTDIGGLGQGDSVNVERSLRIGDRLGGHFMLGHVDGIGEILEKKTKGDNTVMRIRVPRQLTRYMVEKGSVGVDGISLTLFDLDDDSFSVALIPHTLRVTTLGKKKGGDALNIEADYVGKWINKLLPKRVRGR